MYSDGYDESVFKFKKEYIDMRNKIYNKMNNITEVISIIIKINDELKKNIESIREITFKLSDDSRLSQVKINTINAKIDDALNFLWNKIYRKNGKNRKNWISSKWINIDKLELLRRMYSSTNDIISEMKNVLLIIQLDMYIFYGKDMDKVHLINCEIKKSHDSIKTKHKKDI